jgi:HSP20 family molecular chaperone IbpA
LPQKRKSKKNTELAIRKGEDNFPSFNRPFGWPPMVSGGWLGPRWWRSFEFPETRRAFADLIDTGKEYRVHAEVPGIPKEKLNISVNSRGIKIEGEAEKTIDEEREGYVHKERTWSKVKRELAFPEEVIPEKADAQVKDGVLEVIVPKKNPTEMKTHKVTVR